MARTPKEDYRPLMVAAAVKRLRVGEEVKIQDIADELNVQQRWFISISKRNRI
jgi:hypothetical protein